MTSIMYRCPFRRSERCIKIRKSKDGSYEQSCAPYESNNIALKLVTSCY